MRLGERGFVEVDVDRPLPTRFVVAPLEVEPDPAADRLTALVTESACNSGEDAAGRVQLEYRDGNTSARVGLVHAADTLVDGREATRIALDPGLSVGPGSNELVTHVFQPSDAARAAVDAALAKRGSVRYVLSGRIATSEPKTDHPFDYQSGLNPVPGLAGVLR